MSMDRSRYPADWEAISQHIRFERAKGRCEQCGARHGDTIFRYLSDPSKFLSMEDARFDEKLYWDGEDISEKGVRVVLTVHHIGIAKPDGTPGDRHDKLDVREENLIALCQRCHFLADLDIHLSKARESRLRKKAARIEATGQRRLL